MKPEIIFKNLFYAKYVKTYEGLNHMNMFAIECHTNISATK